MDYSESFNRHTQELRQAREAADRDDLNDAQSGTEVGRQRKHLPQDDRVDPITGKKRETASELIGYTLEWLLLHNPEYARFHASTMQSLQQAEETVQTALERILARLSKEQDALDALLSHAATLDGQIVLQDQDGLVWTLDGKRIDDKDASRIEWRGNEPSREQVLEQQSRIDGLKEKANELRGIETELGGIRGELTENDKPPTMERMDDLQRRLEDLQLNVTRSMADFDRPKVSEAEHSIETGADSTITIPTIALSGKP